MTSVEDQQLRERLGADFFQKRLERQAGKRAKLQHQGEGVFRLERLVPFDALLGGVFGILGIREFLRRRFLDVQVVRQEWRLRSLPGAFDGFRLLQLSDLAVSLRDLRGLSLGVVEVLLATIGGGEAPAGEGGA